MGGGTGTRMGGTLPKQFMPLAGVPILVHTVRAWQQILPHAPVVVVLPATYVQLGAQLILAHGLSPLPHTTAGGATRTASVSAGLNYLAQELKPTSGTLVAIHDAVRPFLRPEVAVAALQAADQHGAAVCGVPSKSSLRQVAPDGSSRAVNRDEFWAVQTPQVFRWQLLQQCYAHPLAHAQDYTDDASLVEAQGHRIQLTEGSYDNLKITTPEDLKLAELIYASISFTPPL